MRPATRERLDGAVRQGTLPDDEIVRLLSAIYRGEPWRDALERLELPWLSRKRDWFLNTEKAKFFYALPTPDVELAIDVGSGSGVVAAELARRFARVVALEHHRLWCSFIQQRCSQDGVRSTAPVRGDAMALPVRRGCADLVVLSGVLEWVPEAAPHLNPQAAHLACLRGIADLLKPGGTLGIAIENRWFLGNWLGTSPHAEPPFAAILPRPLSDVLTRLKHRKPYRTWIYGAYGYRRLLREAGFSRIEIRAAVPSYQAPDATLSLHPAGNLLPYFQTARRTKAIVVGALARLGLLGYFVHSFHISARMAC